MSSLTSPDLDKLRWHNRLVLLFANDSTDKRVAEQRELLQRLQADLDSRDLKIFELIGKTAANINLREKFGVNGDEFAVVLIGKDGTRKLHKTKPVGPDELFALIDSMPMRRDEMKQQK